MIYFAMAVGIFLLELGIKRAVEARRTEGSESERLGGLLLFRRYHNRGAFLNLGERRSPLVAALSAALTGGTFLLLCRTLRGAGNKRMKTGLALLLGGALSNTHDRLRRGYVVDYVSFGVPWRRLRAVVFNLSDFCVLIGAALAACACGAGDENGVR